jgi:hypothetical protein
MRKIRQAVPPEAMLQVPEIWPHRNPVHGTNSMWLLCRDTQLKGLPYKGRQGVPKEVCYLQRTPRGLEQQIVQRTSEDMRRTFHSGSASRPLWAVA